MGRKRKSCNWCGNAFNKEESANPRLDPHKDPICDECYSNEYEEDCSRCGERVEKAELDDSPGKIIVVFQEAPALGGIVTPGYYKVKEWPIYADGMIEGYLFANALERVADLDYEVKRMAEGFICGTLCSACQSAAVK